MQTEQEVKQWRPFHESVVGIIRRIHTEVHYQGMISSRDPKSVLDLMAKLIKETKIPAGHLEIIAAWNWAVMEAGLDEESFGVVADLLEQKREAEKEAEKKAKANE